MTDGPTDGTESLIVKLRRLGIVMENETLDEAEQRFQECSPRRTPSGCLPMLAVAPWMKPPATIPNSHPKKGKTDV